LFKRAAILNAMLPKRLLVRVLTSIAEYHSLRPDFPDDGKPPLFGVRRGRVTGPSAMPSTRAAPALSHHA